jgi:hypothetical protein
MHDHSGETMLMHDTIRRSRRLRIAALAAATLLSACAPTGGGSSAPAPVGGGSPIDGGTAGPAWRVGTMEHVDLWLHGFALLTSDTAHVPFFARGYKQQVTAAKRQKNVFSQLDANQQELSARFAANPGLTNAQFLAMYFSSLEEIVTATDFFFRAQGNPQAASDPVLQQQIAILGANFPQAADRNWLRLFVQGLQDESTRFFHAYWLAEQQRRGAAFASFNERWASSYYPKLTRFLNNTQQARGRIVLSVPLGGEGRTINDGKQANLVAVTFPTSIDAAPEAVFVFVHEIVGRIAQEAINDNTTPAEQRSGATNTYVGNGAVRGGLLLIQRVLPELAPEYMRFYLRTVGRTPPTGDPTAAFASAFPLPAAMITAMNTQIGVILGGI